MDTEMKDNEILTKTEKKQGIMKLFLPLILCISLLVFGLLDFSTGYILVILMIIAIMCLSFVIYQYNKIEVKED